MLFQSFLSPCLICPNGFNDSCGFNGLNTNRIENDSHSPYPRKSNKCQCIPVGHGLNVPIDPLGLMLTGYMELLQCNIKRLSMGAWMLRPTGLMGAFESGGGGRAERPVVTAT